MEVPNSAKDELINKSCLDLQLIDFLDIISGERDARSLRLELKHINDKREVEKDEILGTLETLNDFAFLHHDSSLGESIKKAIDNIQEDAIYQFDDFSNIDI